jgi:hypothetical protein
MFANNMKAMPTQKYIILYLRKVVEKNSVKVSILEYIYIYVRYV